VLNFDKCKKEYWIHNKINKKIVAYGTLFILINLNIVGQKKRENIVLP